MKDKPRMANPIKHGRTREDAKRLMDSLHLPTQLRDAIATKRSTMQAPETAKPKACPFCGYGGPGLTVERVPDTAPEAVHVVCLACMAQGPRRFGYWEAVEAWNKAT